MVFDTVEDKRISLVNVLTNLRETVTTSFLCCSCAPIPRYAAPIPPET